MLSMASGIFQGCLPAGSPEFSKGKSFVVELFTLHDSLFTVMGQGPFHDSQFTVVKAV
jgi:hypothetical protein